MSQLESKFTWFLLGEDSMQALNIKTQDVNIEFENITTKFWAIFNQICPIKALAPILVVEAANTWMEI
jgi:hypothetical protein